jgi:TolB-like protein
VAEGGGEEQSTCDAPATPSAMHRHGGSADVFISYASADKQAAASICAALERGGVVCWIAPRDVTPGVFYADAIVQAINSAHILIVVLSVNSVGSQHVLREVERASAKRRPLVAFRLDTAPLPTGLEYFLSASHWLDASGGTIERALPGLLDAVHRLLGPSDKPMADASIRDDLNVGAGSGVAARRENTPKPRWNRLWIAAGAVAVVLLALLAGKFWLSKPATDERPAAAVKPAAGPSAPEISDKSIAVLPFADMSEKKDQEYLADGMAEEIIDLLVKIPGLKVIGRTSSFQFKGKNEDLRAIGAKLGVAYVVEGSVRRSGEQIRVTAQLIDTATGAHTWSDHFDRQSGDVLKIEDEIAAALVRALQITVGAADAQLRPTLRNTEAYNLYLQGRHALDRTDEEGFEEAARHFQQALNLDPTSAATAAWLSETYELQAEFGLVSPDVGFERARRAAQAALAQDPNVAIAHVALGGIHTAYDWDWAAADNELNRALALAPGDTLATFYAARLLIDLGHWNEALAEVNAALAADPLGPLPYQALDWVQKRRGHLLEAEMAARRLIELSPTYLSGHYYLGLVLLERGDREGALTVMQQEAPEGGREGGLAMAYYALGRKVESDAALARLIKVGAADSAFSIAQVYAYRGERDKAIQWLERGYAQKEPDMQYIKVDPTLKNLEEDPRYKALLRKMNLPL